MKKLLGHISALLMLVFATVLHAGAPPGAIERVDQENGQAALLNGIAERQILATDHWRTPQANVIGIAERQILATDHWRTPQSGILGAANGLSSGSG